ncbi:MAG: undecaprenyldiphospho-muramoylpentapeptide beta-N-acetylglucosaminyltransferase [Spirochaetaceae bacterium]|jgi:UDP-N-acetylglucosamine--N-acetylmuramyl-(pentapeptide) pyrophosphoryl-undecaprenol N-acetylglucosamine transferase|nr:undecaprenyldiphospho-muramoylpentapeptide beta-N-acetylglucosaminyltransferase [Spirochaetaceae bacterium]
MPEDKGREESASAHINMKCVAFSGGGTGGHIYPGLAVASSLKLTNSVRIIWIGSHSPLDRKIVEDAGITFFAVKSGKLRRYFSFRNILDVFNIAAGYFQARKILKKEKPAVLFSKGGFASVPPCAAAWSLKIPLITHESDYSPGLATRINAFFADKICLSYKESKTFFSRKIQGKTIHTGNPVRDEFRMANAKKGFSFLGVPETEKILLVLGGSQGAKEVNDLVRETLPVLTTYFVVIHQTGQADFEGSEQRRSDRYRPYAYIGAEMSDVLASAHLVLGRSGAGTVWESAVCGKALLLIPLAGSGTRGDQVENARFFEQKGAATVLIHPNAEQLRAKITYLASEPGKIASLAEAAATIGRINAVDAICALINSILYDRF